MSRLMVSALCVLLVAGCVSFPMPRTYVLGAPLDTSSPATGSTPLNRIQLTSVSVPDYLDSEDILVRQGAHELHTSTTGQWGERLSAGLTHALSADLATHLPGYLVETGPPMDAMAWQLSVKVDSLDSWSDGHCVLSVQWTLRRAIGGAVQLDGQAVLVGKAEASAIAGDAAVISGIAATVAQLADTLAHAVIGSAPSASPPRS